LKGKGEGIPSFEIINLRVKSDSRPSHNQEKNKNVK